MIVRSPATSTPAPDAALVCPRCGARHPARARFCPDCRLPLVLAETQTGQPALVEPLSPRHAKARKIKPQLAEGRLVEVVQARNLAEAELVQLLLLEEGVPSILRRSAGFDVPDFLAAGPRDVLVAESGAATAREVLFDAGMISSPDGDARAVAAVRPAPLRLLAGLLIALVVGMLIVWLIWLITGG